MCDTLVFDVNHQLYKITKGYKHVIFHTFILQIYIFNYMYRL